MQEHINKYISHFKKKEHVQLFTQINRGIEREALRISPNGKLAKTDHPKPLGSALTNPYITTDYSEGLLEFVTPVFTSSDELLQFLTDIHHYTYKQIGDELLWPLSMPCTVEGEDIRIANYGKSNIGQMKRVYRKGLHHRYGSLMQIIAGIHYNFSLPSEFWPIFQKIENNGDDLNNFISNSYLRLIRNFHKLSWLIPYFFGASPSLCKTFINDEKQIEENELIPLSEINCSGYYSPHATSLRMSDLGYQNDSQSDLAISYNTLEKYTSSLQKAKRTPSKAWDKIDLLDNNNEYKQLNTNLLQIENEFYAPIRPKRVSMPGEPPSNALKRGGIEYIEVRSIDINPYSEIGITKGQVHFLDTFLLYCLFEKDSPQTNEDLSRNRDNLRQAVLKGRADKLTLEKGSCSTALKDWAIELINEMKPVAELLDNSISSTNHSKTLDEALKEINNPDLTISGRMMLDKCDTSQSFCNFAASKAREHRKRFLSAELSEHVENHFKYTAENSLKDQIDLEKNDRLSFPEFLDDYFAK